MCPLLRGGLRTSADSSTSQLDALASPSHVLHHEQNWRGSVHKLDLLHSITLHAQSSDEPALRSPPSSLLELRLQLATHRMISPDSRLACASPEVVTAAQSLLGSAERLESLLHLVEKQSKEQLRRACPWLRCGSEIEWAREGVERGVSHDVKPDQTLLVCSRVSRFLQRPAVRL